MSISAMKYALDVLDNYVEDPRCETHCVTAIHFLRQAIAEAEKQEPVAWMWKDGSLTSDPDEADGTWTKLYTAPPKREWVGLTDEEIYDYADKFLYQHGSNYGIKSFGKAIEAKLKEKNSE